uniref:Exocyst complex component 3 like 4 n=1 Tax=Pelusios castaneus TaxID=367368 RepID=A0A8C8S8D8_9SAUR
MDENKEIPETSEKMESPSESASPEQSIEDEETDSVSELNSPCNNQEVKSPERGLFRMLSFRNKQSPLTDKASEDSGPLRRIKKRLSMRGSKRNEEANCAKNMTDTSVDQTGESTGAESIKREPLSVMEINQLIQKKQLLEAFANIRSLEDELITEKEAKKYEDNPPEYARKAKDVDLLYNSVAERITSIVKETFDRPDGDTNLLTSVVTLISKEEKAHADGQSPGSSESDCIGRARKWRDVWKEAVQGSAQERILKVPLSLKEDNESWLAIHLGFLRKSVREDLLKIKHFVQKCYPDDYKVCDTYVESFHDAISSHLQGLLQRPLEFNELYAILDWVANMYHSESLLGHPELKPEIKTENIPQLLSPEVRNKLENDYTDSLKGKIKFCLDNILKLETAQKWETENQSETLQTLYHSSLSLDIQMLIGEHAKASSKILEKLEMATLEISVGELKEFIPRFRKAFVAWDKEKNHPLFVPYLVGYINSFHDLMNGLQTTFNADTKELEKVLTEETMSFRKYVLTKLSEKTQPLFKKILTNAWMSSNEILDSIISTTMQFCQHLKYLEQPAKKSFLNDVHKYLVREYITQAIKPRKRIKRTKRELIGKKMKQEGTVIKTAFEELGSEDDWHSAIHYIADIISEKNKDKIKEHTENLWQEYPDVRKEHIVAVFALRRLCRRKRKSIIQKIDKRQENTEIMANKELFAEIEVPTVVSCFYR